MTIYEIYMCSGKPYRTQYMEVSHAIEEIERSSHAGDSAFIALIIDGTAHTVRTETMVRKSCGDLKTPCDTVVVHDSWSSFLQYFSR